MIHQAKTLSSRAILVIVVANVVFLGSAGSMLIMGARSDALTIVGCVLLGICALGQSLNFWWLYRIRYEITSSKLSVRCGPFRYGLALDDIVEVFPSRNELDAAGIRVNYLGKDGGIEFGVFTPKDNELFVEDLKNAAPRLRTIGDDPFRLKREPAAERCTST
jgi:hypothetical protein